MQYYHLLAPRWTLNPLVLDEVAVRLQIEPYMALPSQSASRFIRPGQGTRALWAAVVRQAWEDATRREGAIQEGAQIWLLAPDEAPHSLRWIACQLGADPDGWQDTMRRRLVQARPLRSVPRRRMASPEPARATVHG